MSITAGRFLLPVIWECSAAVCGRDGRHTHNNYLLPPEHVHKLTSACTAPLPPASQTLPSPAARVTPVHPSLPSPAAGLPSPNPTAGQCMTSPYHTMEMMWSCLLSAICQRAGRGLHTPLPSPELHSLLPAPLSPCIISRPASAPFCMKGGVHGKYLILFSRILKAERKAVQIFNVKP